MMDLLGPLIGFAAALVASRWRYGRQLLALAQQALGIAKATGLDDKIPDDVRRVAEQAVIAANQAEVNRLVDQLLKRQAEGKQDEAAALARGRENAAGMDITIIEPTGDEPTSKPFKKDG